MAENGGKSGTNPISEAPLSRTLFAADWVVPVASPPIPEGGVLVEGPRIVEVGRAQALRRAGVDEVRDLSGHLLLPGLVNAHTHLELSFLKGRISPSLPFDGWIEALVGELREADEATLADAARSGLAELTANGTTAVGDISRSGISHPIIADSGLKGVVFVEVLGFHPDHEQRALDAAVGTLERLAARPESPLHVGITPHAPYSTSPALYRGAAGLARTRGLPLAVHLAETPEEELFVREGRGPLRDLLARFGLWYGDFPIPGCSPVEYLESLGVLAGALAVHCNTVTDDEDIGRLAAAGAPVVLCPASNAWFGRPSRHPLPLMLEAGLLCALGTDSLASNDRLDLLSEMTLCAASHPELAPETVLHMATDWAAEALGLSGRCGSLEAGKAADLVALRLPAGDIKEPVSWVVGEATGEDVALVTIDGAVAHRAGEG
ncbi:MAG: amidohydrolase family protein [Nitrospinae bacterium]|nr:amidohydrolase family protein [Nitrospinota bacterium]